VILQELAPLFSFNQMIETLGGCNGRY